MLGRWGNSKGQLLDYDVLEPLSSCHPKLFLLCLSPLQVMAPPQPSLKGQEPGPPLPLTPWGGGWPPSCVHCLNYPLPWSVGWTL